MILVAVLELVMKKKIPNLSDNLKIKDVNKNIDEEIELSEEVAFDDDLDEEGIEKE